MAEIIYCPFCKRKNDSSSAHCVHCGTTLSEIPAIETKTTAGIASLPAELQTAVKMAACEEHLAMYPAGTLLLFAMEEQEPLTFQKEEKIILGRDPETPLGALLQKNRYRGMGLGVSRHHAQIVKENGIYAVEDLKSTNGTWINRQRLQPGNRYELNNEDRIWLGPVRISVCYHPVAVSTNIMTFSLREQNTLNAQENMLTGTFTANTLGPYIQALSAIQTEINRSKPDGFEPFIQEIISKPNRIQITMEGANGALNLLDDLIMPWREEHVEIVEQEMDHLQTKNETSMEQAATSLAILVVRRIHPTASEVEHFEAVERLTKPVSILASSSIEPVFNN